MSESHSLIEHIKLQIAILQRRLRVLEIQRSRYGERDISSRVVLEIEDIGRQLVQFRAELRRLQPTDQSIDVPYQGLLPFQSIHADRFFGRDVLVNELLERTQHSSLVAVLGPSGSGKSSVVRAGLLPLLMDGAAPASNQWCYLIMKPGSRPLDALASELVRPQQGNLKAMLDLRDAMATDDQVLLHAADLLVQRAQSQRLVLVIDQFEELWTLMPIEPEAQQAWQAQQQQPFLRLLLRAVKSPERSVLVVLTMRADLLHRAAELPELAQALAKQLVLVSPMDEHELRAAIVRPAEQAGGSFEPGLVEELIDCVRGQPGALPMLEYTLLELWKLRGADGTLSWQAYQDLGGVEGSLAKRADAILQRHYTREQQSDLRRLLLRLIQPGEGTPDTRRRVRLEDLVAVDETPEEVQRLLQPLIDERLITSDQDDISKDSALQLSHEALIRSWPTLNRWINDSRAFLRVQIQLEEASREWRASGDNPSLLWSGLRLSNVVLWQSQEKPRLGLRDLDFINTSRIEEEKRVKAADEAKRNRERLIEEQKAAVRLRRFLIVTGILLTIAIFAAMSAGINWQSAVRAQNDADQARATAVQLETKARSLALAGDALVTISSSEQRATGLALASNLLGRVDETMTLVSRALFTAAGETHIEKALYGHFRGITFASWSNDGEIIATSSLDGYVILWDRKSGKAIRALQGHTAAINRVVWSHDNKKIATCANDRTVRVWNTDGQLLNVLTDQSVQPKQVAWSPDDRMIITDSGLGRLSVWNSENGKLIHELVGSTMTVNGLSWSHDGKSIAVGGLARQIQIWDVESGQLRKSLGMPLRQKIDFVFDLAWGFDDKTILEANADGTARVWDVDSGQLLHMFQGHTFQVRAAAWSPDGKTILTGSADNTARLWDAASGKEIYVLKGHTNSINAVSWSPNGQYVLTGSDDSTAMLWDVATGQLISVLRGHTGAITTVSWSPDGKTMLTTANDSIARMWDVLPIVEIPLPKDDIRIGVWSHDGKLLVTASPSDTIRLWDVSSVRMIRAFEADGKDVQRISWSPDDSMVLVIRNFSADLMQVNTGRVLRSIRLDVGFIKVASFDPGSERILFSNGRDAYILNIASGREIVLQGHTDQVSCGEWSLDGKNVLTGSWDGTARLWDALSGSPITILRGHEGGINGVAWNPKEPLIATVSYDGTARIWDAKSGKSLYILKGHTDAVRVAVWSPDGKLLLTASNDSTARIWNADTGQLWLTLQGHTLDITDAAWSPDGQTIITRSFDQTARLWSTGANQPFYVLQVGSSFGPAITWSPDSKKLLWPAPDGRLHMWLMDRELILAALTQRVCDVYNQDDQQIRSVAANWDWPGCSERLKALDNELKTYAVMRSQP